jgi:hypothetical protein
LPKRDFSLRRQTARFRFVAKSSSFASSPNRAFVSSSNRALSLDGVTRIRDAQEWGSWPVARLAAGAGRRLDALSPDRRHAALCALHARIAAAAPPPGPWAVVAAAAADPSGGRGGGHAGLSDPEAAEAAAAAAAVLAEEGVRVTAEESWQLLWEVCWVVARWIRGEAVR